MARRGKFHTFLNAAAATGAGTSLDVSGFKNLLITVAGAGATNLTVKCQGSLDPTEPNWDAAKTAANPWDYIQMIERQDGNINDGDAGVVFAGADVIIFSVNTDGLHFLNFNVTAFVAGSVTVKGLLLNDTRNA